MIVLSAGGEALFIRSRAWSQIKLHLRGITGALTKTSVSLWQLMLQRCAHFPHPGPFVHLFLMNPKLSNDQWIYVATPVRAGQTTRTLIQVEVSMSFLSFDGWPVLPPATVPHYHPMRRCWRKRVSYVQQLQVLGVQLQHLWAAETHYRWWRSFGETSVWSSSAAATCYSLLNKLQDKTDEHELVQAHKMIPFNGLSWIRQQFVAPMGMWLRPSTRVWLNSCGGLARLSQHGSPIKTNNPPVALLWPPSQRLSPNASAWNYISLLIPLIIAGDYPLWSRRAQKSLVIFFFLYNDCSLKSCN